MRRQSIGKMSYRQRHEGLCSQERRDEKKLWESIRDLIVVVVRLPFQIFEMIRIFQVIQIIITRAEALRIVPNPIFDSINREYCNRNIDSFTYNECWHNFRFRKEDLHELVLHVDLPVRIHLKGQYYSLLVHTFF